MKKNTSSVKRMPDPELREMMKLMEIEDRRDEMLRLENERIEYAQRMRQMARPTLTVAGGTGWMDRNK